MAAILSRGNELRLVLHHSRPLQWSVEPPSGADTQQIQPVHTLGAMGGTL